MKIVLLHFMCDKLPLQCGCGD